jgi:CubicO group peptidase (beta-lactamase class C family)
LAQLDKTLPNGKLQGTYDERFTAVAQELERNFVERGEIGASVCLTLEGRTVVDLWGGMADPSTNKSWERDTVAVVFSCTKGATAICAHVLASRGQLDLDAPVAEYWPEFAANGKKSATVRMMLDHSVGLPATRTPLAPGDCNNWDRMVEVLAAEEPEWKPGTRNGYHMINFGWTVGELVRRASGRSLGTFFREEIAGPLGADFWIGAPESVGPRVAPIIAFTPDPTVPPTPFVKALMADPTGIQARAMFNNGGFSANDVACHRAEIGGGGGISNARGLAGIYAPLANGGSLNDVKLVDRDGLARMGEVSMATHEDATLLIGTRFALGFMKSIDNRRSRTGAVDSAILSSAAFGHVGAGGSIGFADPECGLSFGYAMNRMGTSILLNERGQAVVDATYRSLGYKSNASGVWVR